MTSAEAPQCKGSTTDRMAGARQAPDHTRSARRRRSCRPRKIEALVGLSWSSTPIQRRIEDRPPADALAPDAEFQLRSVKPRRQQPAAKRVSAEHRKDAARHSKDFIKRLAKPLDHREAVHALDARGAPRGGAVRELRKTRGNSLSSVRGILTVFAFVM